MNEIYDIAIVGGGASGLMAAITAKKDNPLLSVVILERLQRVGKKLLVTGNGCCNITNSSITENNYHSHDIEYFNSIYSQFDLRNTEAFFLQSGIPLITLSGKMYPSSKTAASVVNSLRFKAEHLGVRILPEFNVCSVKVTNYGFAVRSDLGTNIDCVKLIVAAGGKAQKKLGSDGSGYKLLQSCGHKLTETFPSIVQITCAKDKTAPMNGMKFIGTLSLFADDVLLGRESGEILFTNYGLSGPPVMLISRKVTEHRGKKLIASLDILPSLEEKDILDMLYDMRLNVAYLTLEDFLSGLINKRIGSTLIKASGISPLTRPACSLSDHELSTIAHSLKDYRIDVTGVMGFDNAQVTAGGIRLSEFDRHTLESKLVEGLYACGEILDIDGDCGGYNLQWAWSSGFVAGKSAAKS